MDDYSCKEKIFFVKTHFTENSARKTCNLFVKKFPGRPVPSVKTVEATVKHFLATGTVEGDKNKDNPVENVASAAQNIPKPEVTDQFKPCTYNYNTHQRILPEDFIPRMELCKTLKSKCDANKTFLENILFTCEISFIVRGQKPKSRRYWAHEELVEFFIPTWPSESKKLTVFTCIFHDQLIGPFFTKGGSNKEIINLLKSEVLPIVEKSGKMDSVWFQMDPSYIDDKLRFSNFLRKTFQDRCIGVGGPIQWPERSPDLSLSRFFLWKYIRGGMWLLGQEPTTLKELQDQISGLRNFTPEQRAEARKEFYNNLESCIKCKGGLFASSCY